MDNTNQYLDFYGLHRYDEKLKKYVDDKTKIDNRSITRNSSGELQIIQELKEKIENLKLSYGGLITPEIDISTLNSSNWYFTDPHHPGTYEWINVFAGRNRQESITTLPNSAYFFYPIEKSYFSMDGSEGTHLNWEYICLNQGTELSSIFKINMTSGSINGLTNINTISGTITNLDSIHFHSGGTFSDIYIEVNDSGEGLKTNSPLQVSGELIVDKIGGYGGSQSVITNDGITTFHGTYYRAISVGDETGSKLVVQPENIDFHSSTLGGTLKNVHAINMNNGLISGISDIYSNTGEINLHSGNINMYNGKISGIQDIGFYYQTGIEISQSGIKGSLNSGIQINGTLKMTDPDNAGISDITFINMVSGVIHMDDGVIRDVDEINGHQASFTTGCFDNIETAGQNLLNVNCGIQLLQNGLVNGGKFSNTILDDHITYGGSNNTFTQEYIDQLKNALGIN